MKLFLSYKYLLKKQKLNYYIKYKVFKLIQYTKYFKYWKKYLKPKHIEHYKEYLNDKYNYFKVKNRHKYRLLKFYLVSFYKYKLTLFKILNAIRYNEYSDESKNIIKPKKIPTYNIIKLKAKLKTLYNLNFKVTKKHQIKLLKYIVYYLVKTSQYNSKRYGRLVYYFSNYRYYVSKRDFRKRYIRHYFLPQYKLKGNAYKYLLVKNAIYLQFLKRLIKLFQNLIKKTSNKSKQLTQLTQSNQFIIYKYHNLIKLILNKWYNFMKQNKFALQLFIYRKLKEKKKLKLKKLRKINFIFSNYLTKILKHYLFKNIHFKFYNRNLFITITNYKGEIQFKFSIGLIGYKKTKKKTYYAALELLTHSLNYILKYDLFKKKEMALVRHLATSRYFSFYWNLVKKKMTSLPIALTVITKKKVRNSWQFYKREFINNLLHKIFNKLFIKVILKGTKYRMRGLINKFFKALYNFKKQCGYHVPLILFFPLNNKPHNGCKYSKKKRKKRRRIAKKIKLKLQNKYLAKQLKFKTSKTYAYRVKKPKLKNPLYFVRYRVSRKYLSKFLKDNSTFRKYNVHKTLNNINLKNTFFYTGPVTEYLKDRAIRRFRSRYKFKRKFVNPFYDENESNYYYSKKKKRRWS